MNRNWIAVACARHVGRGRAGGFMQVCHGKGGRLRRLNAGDGIVYYSPTVSPERKDRLQAFTSIGLLKDDRIYQVDMGGGFHPFRRDVNYVDANEASIVPLLDTLDLTRGKQNWGYPFCLGLVEITACDFALIAAAMGVRRGEECCLSVVSAPAFLYADRKAEAGS
jgi:EVE domain